MQRQTRNRVKRCAACGKACAYTLAACNGCGQDLSTTPESFTSNVFTGFIFGVAKTRFPLQISLRAQDEQILVFDDLLSLTTCHLNCIPTNVYIPDLRALFANPARGRALLARLHDAAWSVVAEQFWAHDGWREKMLRPVGQGEAANPEDMALLTLDTLRRHVVAGCNFPPSQYQLHLQFMLPPFTPFHWHLYKHGGHFTKGRFFPVEYLVAALTAMGESPMPEAADMAIEELTARVEREYGVSYEKMWRTSFEAYGASHARLEQWSPEDFDAAIVDGRVVVERPSGGAVKGAPVGVSEMLAADKLALQNYGRPYNQAGQPTGTYYRYAKQAPLPEWS
jgi:hypothetical protein